MYFNKKKEARGNLFQGRFFSCVLDEEHLYKAIRYVELNPIRANLVSDLEDYYWSSAYTRLTGDESIKLNSIKEYLEIDDWLSYLKEPIDEEKIKKLKNHTQTGRPLGSSKFIKRIERKLGITITIQSPGRKRK